jgi:excinuclease UvrABC nuclease subunit
MEITWSTFHTLSEDNVRENVPEVAGVYLLWVKLKNGKWRCFYVGKAENIQERILDHCDPAEPNECIMENVQKYICGYEYAKVAKQSDRDGVEKFLYDHYKPECNKQDPGGTPIPVNLP